VRPKQCRRTAHEQRRRYSAEIEELRRQLSAKNALLAARTAELAAARTGLIAKTLEAEKLKAQLAKLRVSGASPPRSGRAGAVA
jgi:chromosome condensin MukBEF ATPase and DNA-binding subunit MukB